MFATNVFTKEVQICKLFMSNILQNSSTFACVHHNFYKTVAHLLVYTTCRTLRSRRVA